MRIQPTLELLCKICGWRPAESQTMGDVRQHMIDAHGTSEVTLDLSAICSCGSEMRFTFTEKVGDMVRDHFICPTDGNEGWIERDPKGDKPTLARTS